MYLQITLELRLWGARLWQFLQRKTCLLLEQDFPKSLLCVNPWVHHTRFTWLWVTATTLECYQSPVGSFQRQKASTQSFVRQGEGRSPSRSWVGWADRNERTGTPSAQTGWLSVAEMSALSQWAQGSSNLYQNLLRFCFVWLFSDLI